MPQKFSLTIDLQYEDPDDRDRAGARRPKRAARSWRASSPSTRRSLDRLFDELRPGRRRRPRRRRRRTRSTSRATTSRKGLLDLAVGRAEPRRGAGRAARRATAVLLGDIFAKRGLYGEALERYREARAAAPDDPDATLGEIRALLALGWAGRRGAARRRAGAPGARRRRGAGRPGAGAAGRGRRARRARLHPARRRRSRRDGPTSSICRPRSPPASATARPRSPRSTRRCSSTPRWSGSGTSSGALEEERENWAAARAAYERALDLLPTYGAAALALADLLRRTRVAARGDRGAGAAARGRSLRPRGAHRPRPRPARGRPHRRRRSRRSSGCSASTPSTPARSTTRAPRSRGSGSSSRRCRRGSGSCSSIPPGRTPAQARSRARSARDLQHIFAAAAG